MIKGPPHLVTPLRNILQILVHVVDLFLPQSLFEEVYHLHMSPFSPHLYLVLRTNLRCKLWRLALDDPRVSPWGSRATLLIRRHKYTTLDADGTVSGTPVDIFYRGERSLAPGYLVADVISSPRSIKLASQLGGFLLGTSPSGELCPSGIQHEPPLDARLLADFVRLDGRGIGLEGEGELAG